MYDSKYPTLKVFTLMLLTPFLGGILLFIILFLIKIKSANQEIEFITLMNFFWLLLSVIGAIVVYFVSAPIVSAIASALKLERGFRKILGIILFCGFIFIVLGRLIFGFLLLFLLLFMGAMISYFIPAFIVSTLVSALKPTRDPKRILGIALFCGFIFVVWARLMRMEELFFLDMARSISSEYSIMIADLMIFTLATTSGLILAMLALPKKGSYVEERDGLNDENDSKFHDEVL